MQADLLVLFGDLVKLLNKREHSLLYLLNAVKNSLLQAGVCCSEIKLEKMQKVTGTDVA